MELDDFSLVERCPLIQSVDHAHRCMAAELTRVIEEPIFARIKGRNADDDLLDDIQHEIDHSGGDDIFTSEAYDES